MDIHQEKQNVIQKIVFFVRAECDSFLNDIIRDLSNHHQTCKIVIRSHMEYPLIDQWMHWATVCWFEWCDDLIIYGSQREIAKQKKIICRLHSYEAFTTYPSRVCWANVDKLIFVANHIREYTVNTFAIDHTKAITIPNGVNLKCWDFQDQPAGFDIAYVGYINYKKSPLLLLQAFKAIHNHDQRYRLHIAGTIQEPRYSLYLNQMIKEMHLENHVLFAGWQTDLNQWLEDKQYILCTSVLESQNMSVMQAMAKGIQPLIHNFVGAKSIYPESYIWNTIDDLVAMLKTNTHNPSEYRSYIEDHYALPLQLEKIRRMIADMCMTNDTIVNSDISITDTSISNISTTPNPLLNKEFDYNRYWNFRLNKKFSIESVGYWGLGELYNQLLYEKRLTMLENTLTELFPSDSALKILEFGPGTGIFTELFKQKNVAEYSAIDITQISTATLSKQYPQYKFIHGDISDSKHYDGSYDLIFASNVLLHMTSENNFIATINNIADNLKDDGFCILMDPISLINTKSESEHVIIRDITYMRTILQDCGLELHAAIPLFFFMNYPFDRKLLKTQNEKANQLFSYISRLFADTSLSDAEKQLMGNYLIEREKMLILDKGYGLSEKMLIIHKSGYKSNTNITLNFYLKISEIQNKLSTLQNSLSTISASSNHYLNQLNIYLTCLENDS